MKQWGFTFQSCLPRCSEGVAVPTDALPDTESLTVGELDSSIPIYNI